MSFMIAMLEGTLMSMAALQSAPQDLHTYVVDHEASQLYVVVHRAGLLSFLGHEHAIVPREWDADLCLGDPLSAGAHASLVMETASLVIDSDGARTLAGMDGGPSEEDRETIRSRMMDSTNLDATNFPEIRLELRAVEPTGVDHASVEGTIVLRGVTQRFDLPVDVERMDGGRLILIGVLRIHQRDFGIEPESRLGVVKVSNDVDLHFAVSALPTDRPCPTPTNAGPG